MQEWLRGRAPRNRIARFLVRILNYLEVRYRLRVHPFYLRTYHNVTADFFTRCDQVGFEEEVRRLGAAVATCAETTAAAETGGHAI